MGGNFARISFYVRSCFYTLSKNFLTVKQAITVTLFLLNSVVFCHCFCCLLNSAVFGTETELKMWYHFKCSGAVLYSVEEDFVCGFGVFW